MKLHFVPFVLASCIPSSCGLSSQNFVSEAHSPSSSSSSATAYASLRDLAAQHGIFFGAATNFAELSTASPDQPQYAEVNKQQYSLITAENACKWSATEGQKQGEFTFDGCDFLANWTQQSDVNQTFRGHNLCWGVYNPGWLNSLNADDMKAALKDHIETVVKRYEGTAYGWDVVNEAISDGDASQPMFKHNDWYPKVPDYVGFAFKTARAAASPETKLFYNEYSVGSATGWDQAKSDRMFELAKQLQANGTLDGVGLQLHVDTKYDLVDGVVQNLKRYNDLGLEVHMTEVDVGCIVPRGSKNHCVHWGPDEEQQQAEVYAALLKACLDVPACKNFETWGFTDAHTWRAGLHPLPYNETYGEKKAVQAMRDTMQKALVGETSDWVQKYYMRIALQRNTKERNLHIAGPRA